MILHSIISTGGNTPHSDVILGIALFFGLLILVSLAMFLYYNKENKEKPIAQKKGSFLLETIWMIIPTLLVLLMFLFVLKRHEGLIRNPEAANKMGQSAPSFTAYHKPELHESWTIINHNCISPDAFSSN